MDIEIVRPKVGIYIVFDNQVFYKSRNIRDEAISDDAKEMFHYDFVKRMLGTKDNPGNPEFVEEYNKGVEKYGKQKAYMIFPRGRVYYNTKKFYIVLPKNNDFSSTMRYQIRRCFHIPEKDCEYVTNSFYNS